MDDDRHRQHDPGRDAEVDEALDRSRAPVEETQMGVTDLGELSPDRDTLNPVAGEDADADSARTR